MFPFTNNPFLDDETQQFKMPDPIQTGFKFGLWLQRFALSPTIHTSMQIWDNALTCHPNLKWVFMAYSMFFSAVIGFPQFKKDFKSLAKIEVAKIREQRRKALELANTPRSPENP